jgi:hypothetical protein
MSASAGTNWYGFLTYIILSVIVLLAFFEIFFLTFRDDYAQQQLYYPTLISYN